MILYFGNNLTKNSFTYDYIVKFSEFDNVVSASTYQNPFFRMLDMLYTLILYNKKARVVIIEIFSTWAFYYGVVLSFISRLLSLSYVCVLHGGNLAERINNSSFLSNIVFNNSIYNITPSISLQREFESKGFRVKYIPNFINIENLNYKIRNKCDPKLLWVRAFHEIYNPTMAVKVLIELSDKYPNAQLCMIGADKDSSLKSCQKLAEKFGVINKITFIERLSREKWTRLSVQSDIFINTTNFESFGLSLLEAAACGLPIVTTDVGELKYLYEDNKDALLVQRDDISGMVEKINRLICNPELSEKLSVNGRLKSENFVWENMKLKWKHVLYKD